MGFLRAFLGNQRKPYSRWSVCHDHLKGITFKNHDLQKSKHPQPQLFDHGQSRMPTRSHKAEDIWLDTYSTCGVAAMACFSKEILDVEPWCSTQASIVIECKSAKRILCCPSKASKANGPLLILQHGPELLAPIIGARLPIVVVLETISWLVLYAGGSAWGFKVGFFSWWGMVLLDFIFFSHLFCDTSF